MSVDVCHLRPSSSPSSLLQNLKKNVDERQTKLSEAKGEYKTALRNLEMISDEIHERRRNSSIGARGRGVGAEGDSVSGDDISNFKMESDGISSKFSTTRMKEEKCDSASSLPDCLGLS